MAFGLPEDAFFSQRKAFLNQLGVTDIFSFPEAFQVTDILHLSCSPRRFMSEVLQRQYATLSTMAQPGLLIHTALLCGRRVLGRPSSPEKAMEMLRLLSGRRHRLYTALALWSPEKGCTKEKVVFSWAKTKVFSQKDINTLVDAFPLYPLSYPFEACVIEAMGALGQSWGRPALEIAHLLTAQGYGS